jgi:hypothetical protein
MVWCAQYANWSHRKSHTIYGVVGAETGYQVSLNIHSTLGNDSKDHLYLGNICKNDFSDIRFTGSNGTSQLAYWIESVENDTAKIWVKIDENLGDSERGYDRTIFIYYGNASATSESSGEDTFDFFDDFSSQNNWTLNGGTTITDGHLVLSGTGNETQYAQKARPGNMDNYRVKFKVKSQLASGGWAVYTRNANIAPFFKASNYSNENLTLVDYVTADNGTTSLEMVNPKDTEWHTVEVTKFNSIYTTRWDQLSAMRTCSAAENGSTITFAPIGDPDNDTFFDWVFMNRYVETEPSHQDSWKTETNRWFDDKWSSRKSHTIHGAVGAGTDYQIAVIVHHGMGNDSGSEVYLDEIGNEDFSDLRFTSSDGLTSLSYWIESVENDTAFVWVKIAESLGDAQNAYDRTLHMYYGNPTALSESNPYDTFVFFDDFNGTELDSSKWDVDVFHDPYYGLGPQADHNVENSKLILTSPAYSLSEICITGKEKYLNYGMRMKIKICSGYAQSGATLFRPYAPEYELYHGEVILLPNQYVPSTPNEWKNYFINYYQTTGEYHEGYNNYIANTGYTTQNQELYPYFQCGTAFDSIPAGYMEIDWIAIKKCTNTSLEPYHEDQWTRHGPPSTEYLTGSTSGGSGGSVFSDYDRIFSYTSVGSVPGKVSMGQQTLADDSILDGKNIAIVHVPTGSYGVKAKQGSIIENLVIQGDGSPGSVGIWLDSIGGWGQGVQIKNVVIIDCEVGIKLTQQAPDNHNNKSFTECTNISTVVTYRVKKGLYMSGDCGTRSFAYTFINNLYVVTRKDIDQCTGIMVNGGIDILPVSDTLYGSYIGAIIELNRTDGIGLQMMPFTSLVGAFLNLTITYGHYSTYGTKIPPFDHGGTGIVLNAGHALAQATVNNNMHSYALLQYIWNDFGALSSSGDIQILKVPP